MKVITLLDHFRSGSHENDKSWRYCRSGFLNLISPLLVLTLFFFISFQVNAQHPYGFIDGNVSGSDDDLDWEDIWNAQQAGDFSTLPTGSITTGILFDGKAPDSIFTGGGTKDHLPINGPNASQSWQWKTQDGSSSDKTNIQEAGAILVNGVIYFFGNRFSNDGTTTIGFWFFRDEVGPIANNRFSGQHQIGDVLVVADITNGGAVEVIDAYRWVGAGNGTLPSSTKSMVEIGTNDTELAARVNRFEQSTPWPHKSKNTVEGIMPPISFFEGFIDVKGLELTNACFSSFLVETRSSNPVNSILEDFTSGLFNVQPVVSIDDIAVCESETPVTLTAMTDGGIPPLVYSWKKDGVLIPGQSSETLEVSESGIYSVKVTGSGVGGIGSCESLEDTAEVIIYDNPDLVVEDLADCEDGTSGSQSFDLNDAVTDADEGSLSFYTSEADADGASNAIGDPTDVSVNIGTTTYWARSDNDEDGDEGCYSIASFDVSVYDNPDLVVEDLADCEDGTSGSQSFDLNAAVTDDDGGSISFYASEADAIAGSSSISSPYSVDIGTETIWARSDNDDDGDEGCFSIDSFDITVYDNPDLTVQDLEDCEDGETGSQTFDLNNAITEADGGSVSFYNSEADALVPENAIGSPESYSVDIGTETIWARSDNDDDAEEGCFTIASFDVTVYDNPDFDVTDLAACQSAEAETANFDLNDAISNEDAGTLSFYNSEADALVPQNPILDPTSVSVGQAGATYWARLDNDDDAEENCYTIKSFDVDVYDNPDLLVQNLADCEDGDTEAQSFDLNDGVTDADSGSISFYNSEADALVPQNSIGTPASYSVGLGSETIWVRSDNESDGDETCFSIESFMITVYDNPDVTATDPDPICLGESVDLANYVSADGGTLSYHTSQADADNDANALLSSVVTPGLGTTTYYVRSETLNDGITCYGIASIMVTVEQCAEEGCTLGYWKEHTDRWCDAYFTCERYGDIFTSAPAAIADYTLLEVLNLGGGGIYNLGRQSVAALLNTCSSEVSFVYFNTETLIADVNEAFTTDEAGAFALYLDEQNQAGCPLGGTEATTEPSEECESEPASLSSEAAIIGFSVSPVPFVDQLSVQYHFNYVSNVNIQFFNLNGQMLQNFVFNGVTAGDINEMNVGNFVSPGQAYIIKVNTDRESFSKTILSSE